MNTHSIVQNYRSQGNSFFKELSSQQLILSKDASTTNSAGWAFEYQTNSLYCQDYPDTVTGYALNTCMSSNGYSYLVSCLQGNVILSKYTGSSCDSNFLINANNKELGCHSFQDVDTTYSYFYGCNFDDATLQLPPNGKNYSIFMYYDDSQCGTILSYSGLLNKNCIPYNVTQSFYVDYPNGTLYDESTNCDSNIYETGLVFDTDCLPTDPADFTDDTFPSFTYSSATILSQASSNDSNSLSAGAIAGIVISILFGVGLIIIIVVYNIKVQRKEALSQQKDTSIEVSDTKA